MKGIATTGTAARTPTGILSAEHRNIEKVLACLERMAEEFESAGALVPAPAGDALEFLRTYADRLHHGKEEAELFPAMERRGIPEHAGPTAVMRAEHVQGRSLIRAMEEAIPAASRGEDPARSQWMTAARNYSFMLRQHIDKEDHCLFPMADQALLAADQVELAKLFDKVEHEEIGPGVHDKYVRMADALADRYGVRKNRLPGGAKSCGCSGHH